MEYRIEDTFDVSAERYWEVFFSDAYNDAMWPFLNIERSVLRFDKKGEGDAVVIERQQRLVPQREVPKLLQKLVQGTISYTERNTFTARDNAMKTVTTPSFMADRIDNHGLYRLEIISPNKVNRVWEGSCNCKIPLLGKRVEQFLVDEIKESYRKATEFTRTYHKDNPA